MLQVETIEPTREWNRGVRLLRFDRTHGIQSAHCCDFGRRAVRRETCGRRAVLGKDRLLIYTGNMTPLISLEPRCQTCGEKERFALCISFNQDEVVGASARITAQCSAL